MKRNLSAIFIMLTAGMLSANAQDNLGLILDGADWSENDYAGSSRTMGMGNAVTALGGDLGSFQFNPAGSAVASYSQVAVTMGDAVSMTTTTGANGFFQNSCDKTKDKFIFPNGGFSLRFDTGNSTGLKRFSFGFTANATNIYNCDTFAKSAKEHDNNTSSFAGYVGSLATGYAPTDLKDYKEDYLCSTFYNAGNAIRYLPEYGTDNYYAGTTENSNLKLGGPIKQQDKRTISGSKMDYLLNFGFNISDFVYFGFNIGITNLNYNVQESFSEQANDKAIANAMEGIQGEGNDNYFESGFKSLTYGSTYTASGSGIYGKFGIIVTPLDGLRIGAAIQTPTRIHIYEKIIHSVSHETVNKKIPATATSPSSRWEYYLNTPMRFNLGLAYTITNIGLISIDYERIGLNNMRFNAYYDEDINHFSKVNDEIRGLSGNRQYLKASNIVRVGAEVKPIPELAIRAGYNFTENGQLIPDINGIPQKGADTHAFTLGLGYDSPGAFFCDIAAKMAYLPDSAMKVYGDYDIVDEHGQIITAFGPEITSTRRLLNIVGTIGWRF